MAFQRKYLTRNDMIPRDMFQSLTYDAEAAGDDTADITAGTGAGYFPADVCGTVPPEVVVTGATPNPPIPMAIVLVKTKNNTDGSEPAVGLFAVNVVMTSTSTGSGADTVTTYKPAKHTDGSIKTRCQLMAAGQIVADVTND